MIKNRLAGTAALVTFGLAALGAALSVGAAPANAETGASGTASSSDSSTQSSSSDSPSGSGASTTSGNGSTSASTPPSGTISPSGIRSLSNAPTSTVGSTPTSGASSSGGSITRSDLTKAISEATANVQAKLKTLQGKGESLSIVDMFEMQMLMNKLSQLSEMSTSVVSASKQAIESMARNVKS